MKQKLSFLFLSLLFTVVCTAQKDAGIKSLLTPAGELLPLTVKAVTTKLKIKPVEITDGSEAEAVTWKTWKTATGLVLQTRSLKDNEYCRELHFQSSKGQPLKGLPYGLILHGSTLKDCETRFKTLIVKQEKIAGTDYPEGLDGYKMVIKKGQYYLLLVFNSKTKLERIKISVYDPETAG